MDTYLDTVHDKLVQLARNLKRLGGGKEIGLDVADEVISLQLTFEEGEKREVIFLPTGDVRVEIPGEIAFHTLKPENWEFAHECAIWVIECNIRSIQNWENNSGPMSSDEIKYCMDQLMEHGFNVVFVRPC